MSYQALYRKYRPQYFRDLVGQTHITTILENQIREARASHAYLFCGSRGTGKTSTAKIFARAINCLNPIEGDACGDCAACVAMRTETVDIIEIDAASNNGVDDIRALIEQARFTPLSLRYKVYIIDEVHMLSSAASNALLKTLEEPPAHVVFLLATTEPQKLLATVISRCQRFDFRRLSVGDIVNSVRAVLTQAGAAIAEEGLITIARAADGGMRDALSLADQCLAFCGNAVSEQDVYNVLGSMEQDFLFRIADALIESDAAAALRQLDEIVRSGRDLGVLVQDLSQHVRALLLAQACGDCRDLLDCTKEAMQQYILQAGRASQERLLRTLEQLTKTQNEMKYLGQPRILLETMLVRACRPEDESTLLALEDRMDRLEAAMKKGLSAPMAVRENPPAAIAMPTPAVENAPWEEAPAAIGMSASADDDAPQNETPAAPRTPEPNVETAAPARAPGGPSMVPPEWRKLQDAVKGKNMALYIVSGQAQTVVKGGDILTVYFPQSKEAGMNMCNAPVWQETLDELFPGVTIRFLLGKPRPHNEKTGDMAAFFGKSFTVQD